MNSCILMAQIVEEPQLRFTPDQIALAEMLVQFPGLRAEDPPATLKVVGWGNLAQEIQQNYHQGDRVIIEGRLNMNTVDRQEGFKEKRAELTVQRIHALGEGVNISSSATADASTLHINTRSSEPPRTPVAATANNASVSTVTADTPSYQSLKPQPPAYTPLPSDGQDMDDIPF